MSSREVAPGGKREVCDEDGAIARFAIHFFRFLKNAISKRADFSFRERGARGLLGERRETAAEK